ncbi:MAG TPA: histidine kinase dimerization/phosphoacceptor domain -containing protein [Bryobacteraceae bacterium]|nr:histidine kinase dimerization/phosphoacceptor domain -containing protein [Bryobacteraceae bacterium]
MLAQVIDLAEDAIISIGLDQRILLFNKGAATIFGYDASEIIGKPLDLLIPAPVRNRHREEVAAFVRSGVPARRKSERSRIQGLRKDGTEFPAEASISRVDSQDGPLLTVTLRDITNRVAADRQIEESIREKDALLREIHHRVKNNLQVMSSLLGLQSRTVGANHTRQALEDSQGRIHSMALIHELLCQAPEFSGIDTADYTRRLIDYQVRAQAPDAARIQVLTDLEAIRIDLDAAIPYGLIVNELLLNALRHAFPGDRTGELRVNLHLQPNRNVLLVIEDDGVGLPIGFDWQSAPSLGFRLVRMLGEQLKAHIEVRTNGRTAIQVRFAIP